MRTNQKISYKNFNLCIFIFVFFLSIVGCQKKSLSFNIKIITDRQEGLEGRIKIKNLSKDTIIIPKVITITPSEGSILNGSIDLYRWRDKNQFDTIKVYGIDDPIPYLLHYESDYKIDTLELLPEKSHEFPVPISLYYPSLAKGQYLMKLCFISSITDNFGLPDTCITKKFNVDEDVPPLVPPVRQEKKNDE